MTTKPKYAVSTVYLNGIRTVKTFEADIEAWALAKQWANQFKGCLVYFGTLVEQSTEQPMEDSDTDTK